MGSGRIYWAAVEKMLIQVLIEARIIIGKVYDVFW